MFFYPTHLDDVLPLTKAVCVIETWLGEQTDVKS